ncbi:hypothetical protein C5167_030206 [Papaver somniferum]|nr:hypothetical protein C5167_030206 [Papaver somniferum]
MPTEVGDLQKVDPKKACEYFSSCFKDSSTVAVVIVGNLYLASAHPLILQYLVISITLTSCLSLKQF